MRDVQKCFYRRIKGRNDEGDELRWLMTKHGIKTEYDLLLRVIPRYSEIGLVEESYFLAIDSTRANRSCLPGAPSL